MSVNEVPVPQQLCLYEVDLNSLLFLDDDISRKISLSLASISNNLLNESYLKSLSADRWHGLYVLIDPIKSWKKLDSLTVYCAIQVYLEGEIPDPTEENAGNAIANTFPQYYIQLKNKSLVGARIVQLFQISDAPKDGYGSTALDILTSLYDGKETINLIEEGALINPLKKWGRIHYIGTYINLTVNDVARWEGYHFFLFFAGILMKPRAKDPLGERQACIMLKLLHDFDLISKNDERCIVPVLAQQSRYTFARHLSSIFSNLDSELALRLFKSLKSLILPIKLPAAPKFWLRNKLEKVEGFIKSPEAFIESPENFELIMNLVNDLAMSYFTGRLPINLSDDEEVILLQSGLQKRQSLFQDNNDARSNLRNIFVKTLNFYNSISPEPEEVANTHGTKRQKPNELELHKQSQVSADKEEANSAAVGEEKLKKENGSSAEIGAEEIVKELRNVKRQNIVTHCLLSAVIVLTVSWQISEVSLILKLKNGLSHPFKSFRSMIFGMLKVPGTNGQDAEKQRQTEGHTRPPLHMPELPHVG